jgi:hypothetical protein
MTELIPLRFGEQLLMRMSTFLDGSKRTQMDLLKSQGSGMAESFLQLSKTVLVIQDARRVKEKRWFRFFGELKKTGRSLVTRAAATFG